MNPETGEPVSTWYNPGQTWDTVFSSIASTYEECRAECVGVYLCVHPQVLEIFGHTDDGDDIVYANWLSMAYAGLRSLMYVFVSLLAGVAGGRRQVSHQVPSFDTLSPTLVCTTRSPASGARRTCKPATPS